MLKKVIIGTGVAVLLLAAAGGLYIFSLIERRPDTVPEVVSATYVGTYAEAGKAADQWLKALYQDNPVPSVSAAVGVRGQLVWAGVIGYTDLRTQTPAGLDSPYRIGSISKALTATAVMRLVEKDQIALDAPVKTYVPDFADGKADYTIRQLLAHQAGIRHYSQDISESFNRKAYADTRAAAAFIEPDPLLFAPGTGFHYSTYGYTIAALAMEKAAHKPFAQIMADEVLAPAHMTLTHQDGPDAAVKPVKPYLLISGALIEAPEDNVSHKYAGGGYVSTPSDLVRFGNRLVSPTFLTPVGRESLWTPVPLEDGQRNPENYALGFRVGEGAQGAFVHHGGTASGGYSFLLIYPETGLVVALATNYTPMNAGFDRLAQAERLAALFRP